MSGGTGLHDVMPLLLLLGGLLLAYWLWSRAQVNKAFAAARGALVSASRCGWLKSAVVEPRPEKPVVVSVRNPLDAGWLVGTGMDSVRSVVRRHGDFEVRRGGDGASLLVAPAGWFSD